MISPLLSRSFLGQVGKPAADWLIRLLELPAHPDIAARNQLFNGETRRPRLPYSQGASTPAGRFSNPPQIDNLPHNTRLSTRETTFVPI
jgi:hypothetical protein